MTTTSETKMAPGLVIGKARCEFCKTDDHQHCPGAFENGAPGRIWVCPCNEDSKHTRRRPFCRRCKSDEQVNPERWLCIDRSDCDARVEVNLANDPTIAQMRRVQSERIRTVPGSTTGGYLAVAGGMVPVRHRSAPAPGSTTGDAGRRMAVETLGYDPQQPKRSRSVGGSHLSRPNGADRPKFSECLCCGEPTKGGRFLPGHDARLISKLVADTSTLMPAKYLRDNGCSELLIAKLEKRLK